MVDVFFSLRQVSKNVIPSVKLALLELLASSITCFTNFELRDNFQGPTWSCYTAISQDKTM